MATKTIDARVKNKRDTNTNWETNNPILLDGEIVIVDTNDGVRFKIGDGTSRYNQLPYAGVSSLNGETGDLTVSIGYGENTVGNAVTGTAVTEEPNYTPSGTISLTSTETAVVRTVSSSLSYYYSNYKLYMSGVDTTVNTTNISVPNSATFVGNGVTLALNVEVEE